MCLNDYIVKSFASLFFIKKKKFSLQQKCIHLSLYIKLNLRRITESQIQRSIIGKILMAKHYSLKKKKPRHAKKRVLKSTKKTTVNASTNTPITKNTSVATASSNENIRRANENIMKKFNLKNRI